MKPTVAKPFTFAASSAITAAIAALCLAACSPNDGGEGVLSANGTGQGAAPAGAVAPPVQGLPVPPAAVALAPAYAPMPPTQVAAAQPVPRLPAQSTSSTPQWTTPTGYAPAPADAAQPAAPQPRAADRHHVGAITSIEPVRERPEGSGTGAVVGGLLGAVVGNQFGHGTGRAVMTGAGAVGGAVAGNNIERNHNTHVVGYRVSVRLDDGTTHTFQRSQVGNLQVGDRVALDAGSFHRI